MPKTPLRNIRIPDNLWNATKAKAAKLNTTTSEIIREKLKQFLEEK